MLGIIGGSGLSRLSNLAVTELRTVSTPYGETSSPLAMGTLGRRDVVFVARHGMEHSIPPHRVNYRANVKALQLAGVRTIVAVFAVGGIAAELGPGVLAVPDHSPKTADGSHPVYKFESLADAAGQAIEWPEFDAADTTIKGVVAALHYARHGEPNGVVLETGEFIHLRPHGMALVGLGVGSKISAVGVERMTVLGTRMLEAHQVNRIALG